MDKKGQNNNSVGSIDHLVDEATADLYGSQFGGQVGQWLVQRQIATAGIERGQVRRGATATPTYR